MKSDIWINYTILEAKEMKKEILVILYDLLAAFDTVRHQILIEKLGMYGFCKLTIKWMESYLTAVFFETGAMSTPTKSRNPTNCG